jgi:phospholipid/cholesterol/gamma-HCH transport system substrate-binding protein/paraquat-inducible protein B
MSKSNTNYYRLGIFVLSGIGVLIALILLFGSGQFFKESFTVETYIEQSVTGLDIGAPVRFRGVKIGKVSTIALSGPIYESDKPLSQQKQYVVVRLLIQGKSKDLLGSLDTMVANSLGARLENQGITGVNYIEIDYYKQIKDKAELALPFNWEPQYPVIPSIPSQVDMLSNGITKTINNLSQVDFVGMQKRIDDLLSNLNLIIAGSGGTNDGVVKSIERLNALLARIDQATSRQEIEFLTRELIALSVSLRQTIGSMQSDAVNSAENIKQVTEQLNDLTRIASRYPSSLVWGEPPSKIILPESGNKK